MNVSAAVEPCPHCNLSVRNEELLRALSLSEHRYAEMAALVTAQGRELASLKKALHAAFYRRSTERDAIGQLPLQFDPGIDPEQGAAISTSSAAESSADPTPPKSTPRTNGKKRGGRTVLPALLPRREEVHAMPVAELDALYGQNGWRETEPETREELEREASSLFVRVHIVKRYVPIGGSSAPVRASHPPAVIPKGYAGPGLLAQLVVAKFADHLPLYRIERQFAREGVPIARSTLCFWMEQIGLLFLGIARTLKGSLLAGDIARTDDTPVVLLDRAAKGGSRKVYAWPYLGESGEVVFDFTETRSSEAPRNFLAGFQGRYLQGDGASLNTTAANELNLIQVGCMAHARRTFFKAKDTEPTLAAEALAFVRELYAVEAEARANTLTPAATFDLRQRRSRPILDQLRKWLVDQKPKTLPESPIGKAISYTENQWTYLERYLEDGRLQIDNNDVENLIRPLAIGRKNYLFLGGPSGMKTAATLYTITANCSIEGINPVLYIKDVLEMTTKRTPAEIAALTPRVWKSLPRTS